MTELQIQQDLEGKVKGFKFTGKDRKSRHYPGKKQTGLSVYAKLLQDGQRYKALKQRVEGDTDVQTS